MRIIAAAAVAAALAITPAMAAPEPTSWIEESRITHNCYYDTAKVYDDPETPIDVVAQIIWNYFNDGIRRRAKEGKTTEKDKDEALKAIQYMKNTYLRIISEEIFIKRTGAPAQ